MLFLLIDRQVTIMARFSFFGDQEHRVFNYKPIYYDPEEEERRQMFGKVDGGAGRKGEGKGKHAPGSYIQGAWRNGNYARRRGSTKAQTVIGLVGLILVLIVLFYITKFYTLL